MHYMYNTICRNRIRKRMETQVSENENCFATIEDTLENRVLKDRQKYVKRLF